MASAALVRAALRTRPTATTTLTRRAFAPSSSSTAFVRTPVATFSSSRRCAVDHPHGEETFEEFSTRYEKEFDQVQDVFELQRNLNNSFAYDLVPSTSVITAALRAARRVNDFPTAVRIFEGIKAKVENPAQYEQYLEELEPLRKELGIELKEVLYPNLPMHP